MKSRFVFISTASLLVTAAIAHDADHHERDRGDWASAMWQAEEIQKARDTALRGNRIARQPGRARTFLPIASPQRLMQSLLMANMALIANEGGDAGVVAAFAPPAGNGLLMTASFAPFRPRVRSYNDSTYFYIEGDNVPDPAIMPSPMVGITAWQQQIPLPTSYFFATTNPENNTGSLGYAQPNIWRLPLVPTPSASPISLNGNFLRGAVAVAANGIAIFNPRNNRGEYSYAIGELDQYGGHCGLADDYHYHIAPVHLQGVLGVDKPVAWALDGYPIYGFTEPDGTAQQPLDADGGHDLGGWGYHYHARGTAAGGHVAPYLMDAMHGQVVNFGGQVDPQPEVQSMRASGTGGYTAQAVAGAVITAYLNPVAFSVDGSGHFVHNPGGTPSADQYLMRYTVGSTTYDICWRINRNLNPKSLTITWRHPITGTTTTTYTNGTNNRLKAYPMAAWSMARLPDTGATQDGSATFGEDADYSINPPSFTDNGNGTITDNVTGLMWQKTDNGESTWDAAVTNAASVTTGGYSDWRLPTPAEAFSILNHANNPAINLTYFPSHPAGAAAYWWTSDIFGTDATRVWCTNSGGGLGAHPKSETLSAGGTLRFHARYVRGKKPTNGHNYLNNNDGTITDLDTGLMWTQVPSSAMNWNAALAYAEGLATAGYTDWRLPNVKELQTLVDVTLATATSAASAQPCLQRKLFPAATATACWSSTPLRTGGGSPTQAWLVEFGVNTTATPSRNSQGIVSYEPFASTYPVFAVRTANPITRSITQGLATTTIANLLPTGQRVSAVGTITATDNTVWTVPSATKFSTAAKAPDLYNEVNNVTPANIAAASTAIANAPTVVIDADGEVITGYIFADNYFELYANGTLVGVDPVPFTPFNSCFVKFKAKRPVTYAVKLVDWEEKLGIGTEINGADPYHPGDGGFCASFSDGTVTNSQWKAQSFYIAPLNDPALVIEQPNGTHDSSAPGLQTPTLNQSSYALHYTVPTEWFSKTFNDAVWPSATTYTEAQVGVSNKPAYTNFPAQFGGSGAQFIWSSNLVLDNEVIVRYTGPAAVQQIAVEQPSGTPLSDGTSSVAYGNVNLGNTSSKTFIIRNQSSTSALSIGGVTIDGTNASSFIVTTSPADNIPASGNTSMVVQFNPTATGIKTATLHIVSNDASVGAAFDVNLTGTGVIPPPTITNTRTSPNTPTLVDAAWITAQLNAAAGATITNAQLTYNEVTQSTNTVFAETMANVESGGTGGWDGTGAIHPWTVTSTAGAGNVKQLSIANHGAGNICGVQFDKGSASPAATMIHTTNAINATGTAGTIRFWAATANLTAGLGWNFQIATDATGTNWTTRLSESAGANHTHQQYSYSLLASERVSTLRMRFQFIGNGTGGPTGPKTYIDDIAVSTTTGSPSVTLTMYDDGLHGDGLGGDGIYGAQIPVLPAGSVVTYSIAVTDSTGSVTTSVTPGTYTVNATAPATNFTATASASGNDVTVQWQTQPGFSYSVQWSNDLIIWNNIPVGQTNTWTDTGATLAIPKRFYRVMR